MEISNNCISIFSPPPDQEIQTFFSEMAKRCCSKLIKLHLPLKYESQQWSVMYLGKSSDYDPIVGLNFPGFIKKKTSSNSEVTLNHLIPYKYLSENQNQIENSFVISENDSCAVVSQFMKSVDVFRGRQRPQIQQPQNIQQHQQSNQPPNQNPNLPQQNAQQQNIKNKSKRAKKREERQKQEHQPKQIILQTRKDVEKVGGYVGFVYECSFGHRYVLSSNCDQIVNAMFGPSLNKEKKVFIFILFFVLFLLFIHLFLYF